ncbi:MAG TPA: type II toxin-antitoxin system VapC family toxin [Candidatus Acidoferrum sp.]|nr:type II toxin-antitoxin system VapC family toxin [Candidatus Acidoferrum sp.]
MSLVDTSMTLAWVYLGETTEAVLKAFDALRENGAWVPAPWRLEVANVLQMNVNRKRHSTTFRDAALAELALLPIHLDPNTDRHAWGETLHLAERHGPDGLRCGLSGTRLAKEDSAGYAGPAAAGSRCQQRS